MRIGLLNVAIRVAVIAAYVVFTVVFGELFIRFTDPQPLMPRYVQATQWGIRGNIPNSSYRHTTPEVDVTYHINGEGMRDDREFQTEKPAKTCRIALLGDSFFMGYEVALADSLAARLETSLEMAGYNVDVLNFAVSGFGQAEMLKQYVDVVRPYSPDMVITSWHRTDIDDIVRSQLFKLSDKQLVVDRASYVPLGGWQQDVLMSPPMRFLAENSQLYGLVREWGGRNGRKFLVFMRRLANGTAFEAETTVGSVPAEDDALEQVQARRYSADDVALATAVIHALDKAISDDGGHQIVLEIPTKVSRTELAPVLSSLPAESWSGIDTLTPIDALRQAADPDKKLYYERGAGHFTPEAIGIVNNILVEHILSGQYLDACKRTP